VTKLVLYCTNSFLPHLFHNKQYTQHKGSSVAEWLVCSTQAEKGLGSNRSHDAVGCWRCHRQTVHTHRASVHQAAKLVANLLRIARVTAGLAESNGSLPPGLWLTSHAGWLPRTGISSGTLRSAIEYGLLLPFLHTQLAQCKTLQSLHQYLSNTLSTLSRLDNRSSSNTWSSQKNQPLLSTNHDMATPDDDDLTPTTSTTS